MGPAPVAPGAQHSQRDPFAIWWAFGRTQLSEQTPTSPPSFALRVGGEGHLAWMVLEEGCGGWMPVITWKGVAGLAAEGARGPGHNPCPYLAGLGHWGWSPGWRCPTLEPPDTQVGGGLTQLLEPRYEIQKLSINLGM